MSFQLTEGICQRLQNVANEAEQQALAQIPITLQVLSIKKVGATNSATPDRYRVIVSDGVHFVQAMLATRMNKLVEDGEVVKNSIVVIDDFTCSFVQDKRLMIILGFHSIGVSPEKIGKPAPAPGTSSGEATTPAAQPLSVTDAASSSMAPAHNNVPVQRQQARSARGHTVFPIEVLSPYQNNWTIRARVTQKGEIRTYSNQRGEGKLFGVTFMDESGEIRATAFNNFVDEFYDKLQEGKVYYVSKAKVNLAKKKFSNVQNEYELAFERGTEIEECRDGNVPVVKYNFTPLADLHNVAKDTLCDVIAIVKEAGDLQDFVSKFQKTVTKRELTIVDRSGYSVRLTLWGKQAEQFTNETQPVIAWKGLKVSDFAGRSLSMISSSTMEMNPDIPEAHALRGWYDAGGNVQSFQAQTTAATQGPVTFDRSQIQLLNDLRESEIGMSEKGDFFSARGTIMHIKTENLAYPACQSEGCNKKVIEQHDGWRCEKCDRSYPKPSYRYILSMAVADCSGQAWLQGFNDAGQIVFGVTADDLMDLKDRDDEKFNKAVSKVIGTTFNFTCKAKQESFNEQVRVRYGILKVIPLNYKDEANYLRELLSSPWAQ